jgi:hypothetical protein
VTQSQQILDLARRQALPARVATCAAHGWSPQLLIRLHHAGDSSGSHAACTACPMPKSRKHQALEKSASACPRAVVCLLSGAGASPGGYQAPARGLDRLARGHAGARARLPPAAHRAAAWQRLQRRHRDHRRAWRTDPRLQPGQDDHRLLQVPPQDRARCCTGSAQGCLVPDAR